MQTQATNSQTHSRRNGWRALLLAGAAGGLCLAVFAAQSRPAVCEDHTPTDTTLPPEDQLFSEFNEPPTEPPGVLGRIWSRLAQYAPWWLASERASALPAPVPDMYGRQPRTLVVGWNKTLVATQWTRQHGWRMQARNDAYGFLKRAFELGYEIVLWADQPQADVEQFTMSPLVGAEFIRHRLFYDQMNLNLLTVKDLRRLGRDLKRVLVVDTDSRLYWLQPDNALIIEQFDGDPKNKTLSSLLPILEKIQKYNVYDVRKIVKDYNQNPNGNFFTVHEQLAEHANQVLGMPSTQQKSADSRTSSSNWLSRLTSIFAVPATSVPYKPVKLTDDDED